MNPEQPQTPREELEVRLTALLMGELSPEEAAAMQTLMANDAELTALHARLRQAIGLLREAIAIPEHPETPVPVQLSSERRERLLAHFKNPTPVAAAVIVKPRREWRSLVPLALAASLILVIGGSMGVFMMGGNLEVAQSVRDKADRQIAFMMEPARGRRNDGYVDLNEPQENLAQGRERSLATDSDPDKSGWESQRGSIRTFGGTASNEKNLAYQPLPSPENPIAGRTTIWSEDESVKLDVNTATERTFWDTASRDSGAVREETTERGRQTGVNGGEKNVAANNAEFDVAGAGEQGVPQRSVRFTAPAPPRPATPATAPTSGPAVASAAATPAPAAQFAGATRGGAVRGAGGGGIAPPAANEPARPTTAPIYLGSQPEGAIAQNSPASALSITGASAAPPPGRDFVSKLYSASEMKTAESARYPIVDPRAVSEPLSTAGKVELRSGITEGFSSSNRGLSRAEPGALGDKLSESNFGFGNATAPKLAAGDSAPTRATATPPAATGAVSFADVNSPSDALALAPAAPAEVKPQQPLGESMAGLGATRTDPSNLADLVEDGLAPTTTTAGGFGAGVADRFGRSKISDPAKADAARENFFAETNMLGAIQRKSEVAGTEVEAAFETANEFGIAPVTDSPDQAGPSARSRNWSAQVVPGGGGQPADVRSKSKATADAKAVKDQAPADWDRGLSKHMDGTLGGQVDDGNVWFDYSKSSDDGKVPHFRGRGIEENGRSFGLAVRKLPVDAADVAKNEVEDLQALPAKPAQESEARFYREGLRDGETKLSRNFAWLARPGSTEGIPAEPKRELSEQVDELTSLSKNKALADKPVDAATREKLEKKLAEAKGLYDSGRYDLAFKRAEQVLELDASNIEARKLEEKINGQRDDYASAAFAETRSRPLRPALETRAKERGGAKAGDEPVEVVKLEQLKQQVAPKDSEEPAPAPKPAEPAPEPQPEIATKANAFSTFSLNVSDVSFKLAAASLEKGQMPEPATVRSEEFINAFDYRDPEPAPGAPLAFVIGARALSVRAESRPAALSPSRLPPRDASQAGR